MSARMIVAEALAPEPELRIRLRLGAHRQRRTQRNAGVVTVCEPCIEHFGEGYGPLIRGRLGAVVRYHRANQHPGVTA